jgi:hypothetical protein
MASVAQPSHPVVASMGESIKGKRKQSEQRTPTWTKRARFPRQATFDLSNDMKKVPFSQLPNKSPNTNAFEEKASPEGLTCTSCGTTRSRCVCDPLMKELNEMQEFQLRTATWRDHFDSVPGLRESPPITYQQLLIEVKGNRPNPRSDLVNQADPFVGIYEGLLMIEKECVEIDYAQSSSSNKLTNEQWQTAIALHRTLLHEHHDFLVACQHPSASPALRRIGMKYAMPARMWEHGLHGFLELLRSQMPGTSKHMLEYLDHAYSVLDDLGKHVPSLSSEWIECANGLNVYRDELRKIRKEEQELDGGADSPSGNSSEIALDLAGANGVLQACSMLASQDGKETAWHSCKLYQSDWVNSPTTPSLISGYLLHQCQAPRPSNIGELSTISLPNKTYSGVELCDTFQSSSEAKTSGNSTSTSGGNSTWHHFRIDDQEFHAQNSHGLPNDGGPQRPWGITLSQIAILVLAGWLLIGQASSLDFNVFVKVFCILVVPSLE